MDKHLWMAICSEKKSAKEACAILSKFCWWTTPSRYFLAGLQVPLSRLDSRVSCQMLICYYTTLHSLPHLLLQETSKQKYKKW